MMQKFFYRSLRYGLTAYIALIWIIGLLSSAALSFALFFVAGPFLLVWAAARPVVGSKNKKHYVRH